MNFKAIAAKIKKYFAPTHENIYSSRRLSSLERDLPQKILICIVYTLGATGLTLALEWFDRHNFIKILSSAELQGKVPEDVLRLFIKLIDARDSADFMHLLIFGLLGGLIIFWLIRQAAGLPLAKSVNLAHAIEFRQAMEKIGINDPDDRIDFIRKHNVPVYISLKPFFTMEMDNVKVRHYAFSENTAIGSREVFNAHIGNQRLCLDSGDFAILQDRFGRDAQATMAVYIGSLEDTISRLQSELSAKDNRIEQLKQDNAKITDENDIYKNKLRTVSGREKKSDKREESKAPFRRVAYSLVNRLIAHAMPGEKYKRPQIQAEFTRELDNYPDLEASIRNLLQISKKEVDNTNIELDGWAMEEIRSALGEYVQTEPGRRK